MNLTLENVTRYVEDARDGFIKTDKYFFEDLIAYLRVQPEIFIENQMLRDEKEDLYEENADAWATVNELKKEVEQKEKLFKKLQDNFHQQRSELDYTSEQIREKDKEIINLKNEYFKLNSELDEAVEEDLKGK